MVFRCNQPSQFVTLQQAVDDPLPAFTITMWIRSDTQTNAVILSYMTQDGPQTLQNAEFAVSDPEALTVFVKGLV